MWLAFAFLSAFLLGFYDVSKKYSLRDNAVIPILFLNTLFCSIIFLPLAFQTPFGGWEVQRYIVLKAFIVLKDGYEPTEETKLRIMAYCKKNVARYAMPYDIEFRDSLPLTLVGKVAYRELEEEELKKIKNKTPESK